MKKVVASLLAAAGMVCVAGSAVAQTQVNLGSNQQAANGGVQMSPAEYNAYNSAITQATPQAKAPALEAYLTAYPQSAVKGSVLEQLMLAYSAFDPVKSLDAADRLLQVDPNNLRGLTFETYFRLSGADSITDASAKQAALDKAADYAQKGLAAPKPAEMSDADFTALQGQAKPVFYRAIGTAALNKKDAATAVTNFKQAIASVPVAETSKPGPTLQDTYELGYAYYQMTPPDFVNCTWYASRAANFAPEPYKTTMLALAKFCYKKYHGADDGYDAVTTAVASNLNPPSGFTIKPAPSPADIVANVIATTPDLSTLAVSDKEFILTNGKPEDAAKVWDTLKGKSVQLPDVLVIESTPTVLKVAVSDDAVQSKTADFTFNLAAPDDSKKTPAQATAAKKTADDIAAATAVGQKVTLTGTYASYTTNPVMITMSDGAVVLKKAAKPTPAHHPAAAAHRPAAH
jgi:tetratricopeptide (TPR) repeat protein